MIADVFSYARTRLKVLGFGEWPDAFSYDGIPKTQIEKVYHLDLGTVKGVSNNQRSQLSEVPFTIRLFKTPSKSAIEQRDACVALGDRIINDFISAKNRFNQAGIKNVSFSSLAVEKIAKTNEAGSLVK